MNRHPNIAFFGGTVVIAIMVMATFANVANAGSSNAHRKAMEAEANKEALKDKADKEAEVEA